MLYPIGIQTFEEIRERGFVYVDKTDLIYKIVSEGKIYFLSRPRRFGKSLLLSTIKAYFQGKRRLFEGLAMERLEKNWEVYPVFHIDFNGTDFTRPGSIEAKIESFLAGAEESYGTTASTDTGVRFASVLANAHRQTGHKCVVLVDEYDKPLLDVMDTPQEQVNRNELKAFYSTFKLADEHLRFVMLTGVTKFSQISVFSGFNQPNDISMDPRYDTLCGITEKEMDDYFSEEMAVLAETRRVSMDRMKELFRLQYDGYHFSQRLVGVYNPFSVLNSLEKKVVDDYWFRSGSPTYLVRLLEHCGESINELAGRYYPTSRFIDYRADVQQPLPMIYQSGYLTVKDYDMEMNEYLLDFPNVEVRKGFLDLVATEYLKPREDISTMASDAARALRAGNLDALRDKMTAFLASIPYSLRQKSEEREKERFFQLVFYLVARQIGDRSVFVEKETSQGRADCVIETGKYVYIFEFKRDSTAQAAIDQIRSRGYAREYATDPRKVFLVGCNFSTDSGTIDDWIAVEG